MRRHLGTERVLGLYGRLRCKRASRRRCDGRCRRRARHRRASERRWFGRGRRRRLPQWLPDLRGGLPGSLVADELRRLRRHLRRRRGRLRGRQRRFVRLRHDLPVERTHDLQRHVRQHEQRQRQLRRVRRPLHGRRNLREQHVRGASVPGGGHGRWARFRVRRRGRLSWRRLPLSGGRLPHVDPNGVLLPVRQLQRQLQSMHGAGGLLLLQRHSVLEQEVRHGQRRKRRLVRGQLQRLGRAGRIRLRAREPGHPDTRQWQLVFVSFGKRLQGLDALVRPHAHQLLLHGGRAVHERQMHLQLEQRDVLPRRTLHRGRHRGLSGLPIHRVDSRLPHLHRVPLQHDMLVPNLLLHERLGVRKRPLHPERSQRQLLRLHRDGHRRRSRLPGGA